MYNAYLASLEYKAHVCLLYRLYLVKPLRVPIYIYLFCISFIFSISSVVLIEIKGGNKIFDAREKLLRYAREFKCEV